MQLGTKRNYKVVEEKLLGFVLVYKLACTELHGSDSFVKCVPCLCQNSTLIVNLIFDNIRLLIEERITNACYPKCFCCLVQVSYHGFNKKK